MRKPRSDSKLKTLPDEIQQEIFERIDGGLSYSEARAWMGGKPLQIATSEAAISVWFRWYRLQERVRRAEDNARSIVEKLAAEGIDIDAEKVADVSDKLFLIEATETGDAKAHALVREIMLLAKRERRAAGELELKRDRFEVSACEYFLDWFEDKAATEIAGSSLSRADKIKRLRSKYFADVDAMEKAGTVEIPA